MYEILWFFSIFLSSSCPLSSHLLILSSLSFFLYSFLFCSAYPACQNRDGCAVLLHVSPLLKRAHMRWLTVGGPPASLLDFPTSGGLLPLSEKARLPFEGAPDPKVLPSLSALWQLSQLTSQITQTLSRLFMSRTGNSVNLAEGSLIDELGWKKLSGVFRFY